MKSPYKCFTKRKKKLDLWCVLFRWEKRTKKTCCRIPFPISHHTTKISPDEFFSHILSQINQFNLQTRKAWNWSHEWRRNTWETKSQRRLVKQTKEGNVLQESRSLLFHCPLCFPRFLSINFGNWIMLLLWLWH